MTAIPKPRRVRFSPARQHLGPNSPWGVYDNTAHCWAVEPTLRREDAVPRAESMDAASRGRGR